MTIIEAMRAVDDEYSEECLRAQDEPAFGALLAECLGREYAEIDWFLPGHVGHILAAQGLAAGTIVDPIYYQMARMVFRLGMRVQRKLDHPAETTSFFWRSDQAAV